MVAKGTEQSVALSDKPKRRSAEATLTKNILLWIYVYFDIIL